MMKSSGKRNRHSRQDTRKYGETAFRRRFQGLKARKNTMAVRRIFFFIIHTSKGAVMATTLYEQNGTSGAAERNAEESREQPGRVVMQVPAPAAGESAGVAMVAGSEVRLPFNPGEADVSRSGNDLTFQLDNGGSVTISDFFVVEEGGELPMLILPEGDAVPAALAFADSGLDLSTAAGPSAGAATGSGTTYDDNAGDLLLGLDKYGMLGTDYWGRTTERTEEYQGLEFPGGDFGVDVESDLGGMFGIKGGVYEDGLPWQHLGDRESFVPGQLVFTFEPTGSTVVTGIHLSGFHAGTVIYLGDPTNPDTPTITVTGPDQVIDFTEADFANGVYLVPPENSDRNMDINASVDIRAESSGISDTITGGFTVTVDAVADRPDLGAASAAGDSSSHVASENHSEEKYDDGYNTVQSTVSAGEKEGGATVTVTVSATFDDYKDGSESHYLLVQTHPDLVLDVNALPDGYTYVGPITIDGVTYHQIAVDNGVIAEGGGTVSLPVVFETSDQAGEKSGSDQQFDLKVGAYAEEDVDPSGEIDLNNNTAHIVSEDGKGVTATVDVVNGTLNVSAGWAYEGNNASKHKPGQYKPGDDDFDAMDGGAGVDSGSTGDFGAPISIGLAQGSAEGSAEFITSAEFSFSEGRGELLVGGKPVYDGMEVDGENGVTYTFSVNPESGAVTVTVSGGHVTNLDELDMSFRPSQTGDARYMDDDVEFSYKVNVENEAGAKGQFEGKTEIVIDAVADKPVDVGGAGVGYGGDGKTAAVPGQDVELSFKATFPDTSGSEEHTIFIRVDGNNGSATHGYGDHLISGERIGEVNGIAGSNVLNPNGDYLEITIPPLDQFVDGVYTDAALGITITYHGDGSYTVSGIDVTLPDRETLTDGKQGNGELNENGDTSMNFGSVAWAHEKGGASGSDPKVNNEHDTSNNDAFTSGNAKVDIATVGGDSDDFAVGGGDAFENDMAHNNVPQNPADPAGSPNNSGVEGGVDLSVTWDFSDSKEYVSEIILTVPVDRWGNPVGDIYYKGDVVEPGEDGKVRIPVDSADGKSGIQDGDLVFVPKGHDSGKVEIGVEATVNDPRSNDSATVDAGKIEVDVDAVANRSGEVKGEAAYGEGLEAVATGDPVVIRVGTTFADNDGSERHFVLVEQKPHWEGAYEVEYYDLDGKGLKPYFKVPVPTAPPENAGDDYAGDAHHLSAADWATLCETGAVTTANGVTITIPKGADGKPDPSGEWTVKADAQLDPPRLAEGSHEVGTGSLVEEHDVNHATENRDDEYKDNNIGMRPGNPVQVDVNNTGDISVETEFLYEAGEQMKDGDPQNGVIHVAPSSGDDSFYGDLTVSIPSGHGSLYYNGQELKPGVTLDDVTLYDKDGKPVTGSLEVTEKDGQLSVTFKPDNQDANYKGIDLEVRLDGKDYSDTDITVSVEGNLQNDKSGQKTGGLTGEGEVMVDAVAQAPDDLAGGKEEQESGIVPGSGKGTQITLTATFDDTDGSEEHFFLLEAKPGLTYTVVVDGEERTYSITDKDCPVVKGPDGTVYFKIPAEHGKDGKASLDVTVKADDTYRGGSSTDIKYGAMSEDTPTDDGEKTYDNNIDFSEAGSLPIEVETGPGPGPVSVGPAYENNTPNAHEGNPGTEYPKVNFDLAEGEDGIWLKPGDRGSLVDADGKPLEGLTEQDGWYFIPKDRTDEVHFKVKEDCKDDDIELQYKYNPDDEPGSYTVQVDAVAQQGSVESAVPQTDGNYTAVGEGDVTVTVQLSGLVDQDGSSDYYVLIQAKPGWECPDGELVLIKGEDGKETAYFRVPVNPDDIDEHGNVSVDVTLKTPPAGPGGVVSEELEVGSMVVDTPTDGEQRMDNNVSVNVNGKVQIEKSVAEKTLVLEMSEGYEDNLGGTASIGVSGVGNHDVVTEMHFSVDPAEGAFTFNGEAIGPDGYSDAHVTITVSTVDGKTVISITPRPPATGFDADALKEYVNGKLGLATAEGNHSNEDIDIRWGYTVQDTKSGHTAGEDNIDKKVVIDAVAHEPKLVEYDVDYGDGRHAAEPGDTVTVKGAVEFTNINGESNYVLVQSTPGWEVNGITLTVGDKTIHFTADEVRGMDLFYPNGTGGGGAYYKVPLEKGDTTLEPGVAEGGKYQVRVEVETKVPESGISGDTQGKLGIGGAAVDSYTDGETDLSNNVASDTGSGDGIHIGIVDSTGISAGTVGDTPEEGVDSIAVVIEPVGGKNDVITGLTLTNPDKSAGDFYYDNVKLEYDDDGRVVLPPAGLTEEELKDWKFDSGKLEFRPDEHFGGELNIKVEATVSDGKSGASREGFETDLNIEVTGVATPPTGLEAAASFDQNDGGLWTLTLGAAFVDTDGSEEHFFLVRIPDGLVLDGDYPGMVPAEGPNGEQGYYRIPVDPHDPNPSLDLHFRADSTWDGAGEVSYHAGASENGETRYADDPAGGNASAPGDGFAYATEHVSGEHDFSTGPDAVSGDMLIYGGDGDDTITGGLGDNVIHGGGGNDILVGNDGNDVIYAGSGNNVIVGGGGNDTLYGGSGEDVFFWDVEHFGQGEAARDVVNDFEYGKDSLRFNDVFGEDMDLSSVEGILGFLNGGNGSYDGGTLSLNGDSCTISADFSANGVSLNINCGGAEHVIEVSMTGNGYEMPASVDDAAEILRNLISQGAL